MEIRVQLNPSQPYKVTTGAGAAAPSGQGAHVLRETFNRLKEADELRQQGKLDSAQHICEELLREYPGLVNEDIQACLLFASQSLAG